jgi:hypothetical protein
VKIQENDKNAVELPILRAMKSSFKGTPVSLTSFLKPKKRLSKESAQQYRSNQTRWVLCNSSSGIWIVVLSAVLLLTAITPPRPTDFAAAHSAHLDLDPLHSQGRESHATRVSRRQGLIIVREIRNLPVDKMTRGTLALDLSAVIVDGSAIGRVYQAFVIAVIVGGGDRGSGGSSDGGRV